MILNARLRQEDVAKYNSGMSLELEKSRELKSKEKPLLRDLWAQNVGMQETFSKVTKAIL